MSSCLTAKGVEQVLPLTSNETGVPQEPACACVQAAACPQVVVCWWKSPSGAVHLVYCNWLEAGRCFVPAMSVQVSSGWYWTPPEVEEGELAVAMVDLLPVDVHVHVIDISHIFISILHKMYYHLNNLISNSNFITSLNELCTKSIHCLNIELLFCNRTYHGVWWGLTKWRSVCLYSRGRLCLCFGWGWTLS